MVQVYRLNMEFHNISHRMSSDHPTIEFLTSSLSPLFSNSVTILVVLLYNQAVQEGVHNSTSDLHCCSLSPPKAAHVLWITLFSKFSPLSPPLHLHY